MALDELLQVRRHLDALQIAAPPDLVEVLPAEEASRPGRLVIGPES
jgi:hypothetical protein